MNAFEYNVSLRITHPTLHPDEISDALSMKPKFRWTAGEPCKTATGEPLKGFRKLTYWSCRLEHRKGVELSDFLAALILKLKKKEKFLKKIRSTRGSIEFFVGWFMESNSGQIFDWKLMQELSKLQISLALDIYGEECPARSDATQQQSGNTASRS